MTDAPSQRDSHNATDASNRSMQTILHDLRQRQRVRDALRWGGRGTMAGAITAMVLAVLLAISQPEGFRAALWMTLLCVPVGAVLTALCGWLRRVDDLQIARSLDRAAAGEDRFASAVQLVGHRRQNRARMVMQDALARVGAIRPALAIPLTAPPELRWLPLPVVALAMILWLAPGPRLAAEPVAPEVSPEEWQQIHDDFQRELTDLPEPRTEEERELVERLAQLADLLERQPDKKDALAKIAELRRELEQRQQAAGAPGTSLRQAASAVRSAEMLRSFAAKLQTGDYKQAADALRQLADRLNEGKQNLSAADFENFAGDFDALAAQLGDHAELSHACRKCASAASSMNRKSLADALRKLSESLNKNADKLRNCDSACRSKSMLDRLVQRLNQCRGGKCGKCSNCGSGQCKGGNCSSFVRRSDKKGGQKAGWGTAGNWAGGALPPVNEDRIADVVDAQERQGQSTTFSTVSPDERAQSAQNDRDRYVELIRKAEADLALESVPLTYRDYLRRYFVSIRPADEGSAASMDANSGSVP